MKKTTRIIFFFLFVFLFSSTSYADEWNKGDKYLYGGFTALQIIDCFQTRYIYRSPRYSEAFPLTKFIIDDKPERIIPMFAVANLLTLYVADKLPGKWRQRVFKGLIGFEIYAVGRNYGFGVKFYF